MTGSGPQKVPGAVLDLFFGNGQYSGSPMEVNTGLLHTTEGPTLYDYNKGSEAPNVTLVPNIKSRILVPHQHFDVDESARALVNAPGGVQTNTLNIFQIELVGTCDPVNRISWQIGNRTYYVNTDYIFWPEAPDWALYELAKLVRWLSDNHHIPMQSTVTWRAYPGSGQANNGVRLSFDQWLKYSGWCGHQHAPENLHGDPGNIDMARILMFAKTMGDKPLPPPPAVITPAPPEVVKPVYRRPLMNRYRGV